CGAFNATCGPLMLPSPGSPMSTIPPVEVVALADEVVIAKLAERALNRGTAATEAPGEHVALRQLTAVERTGRIEIPDQDERPRRETEIEKLVGDGMRATIHAHDLDRMVVEFEPPVTHTSERRFHAVVAPTSARAVTAVGRPRHTTLVRALVADQL